MDDDLDLIDLFRHQDQALAHNLANSQLAHAFSAVLTRSVRVNFQILRGMKFQAEKQTAIRIFAVDAMSHIIVGARVALWGAVPECLSMLRGGVESCAQLAYMVTKSLYQIAIKEASSKRFRELDFATACRGLGEGGKGFLRKHGEISNVASHSTARRIRLSEYVVAGESYDRLGFALDPEIAMIGVGECMELSQGIAASLHRAFSQDGAVFNWTQDLQTISETQRALKKIVKSGESEIGPSDK